MDGGGQANVSQRTVWVCFKSTGLCSACVLQLKLGLVRSKTVKFDLL